ncbi:hypothetical protein [Neorhizobium galegae]|uniref:hypothetical protein n=1 Tax=Neorhizobium galegae TaxID=399 RepID=UPI00062129E8|nr:hypothetical protein [Neorhizobium galegae]KAB1124264.1 hypothetical protein F4V90_11655 [Neorhizobium galegae]MCQ1571164.1 hypothetical protein [Neorhizobium galegae]MCQ1809627.1 hypothetical protein [Neorhizobium galegae]CDZ57443.1 Hypothetical protein NGAL_HAMBI2566_19970 [Neorhizobium galegae bv. orientalis]
MDSEIPDHVPPTEVAQAAEKGLKLRSQHRRGGTMVGVARARDLKNRKSISEKTVRRMVSYFSRHKADKRAENFGDDDNPSTGYIAWLLWGGDAGQKWAEEHKKAIEKAKNEAKMRRFTQSH